MPGLLAVVGRPGRGYIWKHAGIYRSSYSGIHRYIRKGTGRYGDIRAQVHIKGYTGIYRAQPDIRRYRDKRDSPSQPPWSHMAAEPPWVHPWLPRCPLCRHVIHREISWAHTDVRGYLRGCIEKVDIFGYIRMNRLQYGEATANGRVAHTQQKDNTNYDAQNR